jgi:hypothetical protein
MSSQIVGEDDALSQRDLGMLAVDILGEKSHFEVPLCRNEGTGEATLFLSSLVILHSLQF